MRIVLYDLDLEPITILEIPHWRSFDLPVGEPIRLPVMREIGRANVTEPTALEIVNIRFERLRRGDASTWMALTADAEAALRLRAAFLPGQQTELQRHEQEAFAKGFIRAIEAVFSGGRPA